MSSFQPFDNDDNHDDPRSNNNTLHNNNNNIPSSPGVSLDDINTHPRSHGGSAFAPPELSKHVSFRLPHDHTTNTGKTTTTTTATAFEKDKLIPSSELFPHEYIVETTANHHSSTATSGDYFYDKSRPRVAYTSSRTPSLFNPEHEKDIGAPRTHMIRGSDLEMVETTDGGGYDDTASKGSRRGSTAGSGGGDDIDDMQMRTAFIPRHILCPPDALNIVLREFEDGDLDGDVVALRKKAGVLAKDKTTPISHDGHTPVPLSPEHDGMASPSPTTTTTTGDDINNITTADPELGGGGASDENPQEAWLEQFRSLLRTGRKLDQFQSTAIAGNDLLGSVIYMVGNAITVAGVFAPFCALIIATLLYFFKNVYASVSALPSNGGVFNLLLNSTRKSIASIAAVLTLLSYIATGVVCSVEGVHALKDIVEFDKKYVILIAAGILLFFAILSLVGIGESAGVALTIFGLHISALLILIGVSIVKLFTLGDARFDILQVNWEFHKTSFGTSFPQVAKAIFLGVGACSLGVSGFEASSGFISEQRKGVYLKTLRNMHLLALFFNTIIPLCCVFHLNIPAAMAAGRLTTSLSELAFVLGGRWLQIVVCVDSFLVLSGGVLTAYVGTIGIAGRLSLDRVMPLFFLKKTPRNTPYVTIIGFLLLCVSLLLMLNGDSHSLTATYSVSFLCVMALFALGVMAIKINRTTLVAERPLYWSYALIGFVGCVVALSAVIVNDPNVIIPFLIYASAAIVLIEIMLCRMALLSIIAFVLRNLFGCCRPCGKNGSVIRALRDYRDELRDQPMVFLTRNGNPYVLNKAMLYIEDNEDCNWVRIVHFYSDPEDIPRGLDRNVRMLNETYPKMRIDLILVQAEFNPATLAYLSVKLNIPRNLMFISTPKPKFKYKIGDLGGTRLIAR